MYAIIETGGKQYLVHLGDTIYVEKLDAEQDSEVTFDKVLAIGGEGDVRVGTPYLDGETVVGRVIKTAKGKKITVFTYKPKKNEKRTMGHRQYYTKVEIDAIGGVAAEDKPKRKPGTAKAADADSASTVVDSAES